VDAADALAGYAACDPKADLDREGYLSAFWFPGEFRAHLDATGSTRDYAGRCYARWLWFDIDREDDLPAALQDARALAGRLLDRYRSLDEDDLLLFFSGSKGFHVGLPLTWKPPPSATFHLTARTFAQALAGLAGARIDAGIYDKVRAFRAPNSRHPRTGLHKRRLSVEELMRLPVERIQDLASKPVPFGLPWPKASDPTAVADWRQAEEQASREAEGKAQRRATVANGEPRLNRSTLDFIRDGAEKDQRHRLLFSAAANLAEFGCPAALAHALLTEAALDSGLPPADVHRQIECGLTHAGPIPPATDQAPGTPAPSSAAAEQRPALQELLAALWNAPPPDSGDAWESEQERRDAGKHDFAFGANLASPDEKGGNR
jgi:hypothetical protein